MEDNILETAMKEKQISEAKFAKHKADNEEKRSAVLEIELSTKKGEVVIIEDMKQALGTAGNELSMRLLAVPGNTSSTLAKKILLGLGKDLSATMVKKITNITDAECDAAMTGEITKALEEFKSLDIDDLVERSRLESIKVAEKNAGRANKRVVKQKKK